MTTLLRDVIDIPEQRRRRGLRAAPHRLGRRERGGAGHRRLRRHRAPSPTPSTARSGSSPRPSPPGSAAAPSSPAPSARVSRTSWRCCTPCCATRRPPAPRPSCRTSSPSTTATCTSGRSCRWPSTCSAPRPWKQALFDGYIRQIRALHPDAPLPAVHKSDALLVDAERLRDQLGDDGFFDRLNGGAPDSSIG